MRLVREGKENGAFFIFLPALPEIIPLIATLCGPIAEEQQAIRVVFEGRCVFPFHVFPVFFFLFFSFSFLLELL